jgi:hypothetical protein
MFLHVGKRPHSHGKHPVIRIRLQRPLGFTDISLPINVWFYICLYHNFPGLCWKTKSILFLCSTFLYNGFDYSAVVQGVGVGWEEGAEKRKLLKWGEAPIVSEGFQLTEQQCGLLAHSLRYKPNVFHQYMQIWNVLSMFIFYWPFVARQLFQLLSYMLEFSRW